MSSPWRLLVDDGADAAGGLALDEALMAGYHRGRAARLPTLRLYTYRDHCALVGRYQHLAAEVDVERCQQLGIGVNRRPTGGGAIIMGTGQLGVAFVTAAPAAESPRQTLERCSAGIVAGLTKVGLSASFGGKNDLLVEGRKVAGLGLYLDGSGGLLFHASVLADLDVVVMLQALRVPARRLGDGALDAVNQRVTTVTRETGEPWDGASLREAVALGFTEAVGAELRPDAVTDAEEQRAGELRRQRYEADSWLMCSTPQPDATATATIRTSAGMLRVYLALQGDVVKSALFTGDVNELPPQLAQLESVLKWQRLDPVTLPGTIEDFYRSSPIPDIPAASVVGALLEAGARAASSTARGAPERRGSCYFPEVT